MEMNFSITMHIEKRSRKVELKDLSNIIQRNISVVEQWMIKKVLTRECHIWTWLEFYRNPFDTPNICIFRWSTHSKPKFTNYASVIMMSLKKNSDGLSYFLQCKVSHWSIQWFYRKSTHRKLSEPHYDWASSTGANPSTELVLISFASKVHKSSMNIMHVLRNLVSLPYCQAR